MEIRDAEGWLIVVGAHVRLERNGLYTGRGIVTAVERDKVTVRDAKRGILRYAYPDECIVVKVTTQRKLKDGLDALALKVASDQAKRARRLT